MKEIDRKNRKMLHINGTPQIELTLTRSAFQGVRGRGNKRGITMEVLGLSNYIQRNKHQSSSINVPRSQLVITTEEQHTSPSSINVPRSQLDITTEDKCRNKVKRFAKENVKRQL